MPEYTLEESTPLIIAIRRAKVTNFFVEFLQQGGPKPHVVIRLKTRPVKVRDRYWGCRLAMDSVGSTDGEFHITPITFENASHAAHAAFEFRVKQGNLIVDQVLAAVAQEGYYDLSDFSFADGFRAPGGNTEYLDGCRDFM